MHAKLPDTIKSQALNENFNLQPPIASELCEYEKWNRTNVQSSRLVTKIIVLNIKQRLLHKKLIRLYLEIALNGVKKKTSYLQEHYFGLMNQSHLGRAIILRINQLQTILT